MPTRTIDHDLDEERRGRERRTMNWKLTPAQAARKRVKRANQSQTESQQLAKGQRIVDRMLNRTARRSMRGLMKMKVR